MITVTLVEQIVEIVEVLRTQLEGDLDQIKTADVRGRINGMKAVLKMIEDLKKADE